MARIRMAPGASEQSIIQNFQRIENASESERDVAGEISTVTGSLIVETGLSRVDTAMACLANAAPVAGACFVIAYPYFLTLPAAPRSQIVIGVYTNAFAVSVIPVPVSWIAMGERILG